MGVAMVPIVKCVVDWRHSDCSGNNAAGPLREESFFDDFYSLHSRRASATRTSHPRSSADDVIGKAESCPSPSQLQSSQPHSDFMKHHQLSPT
jgi:hypothetical protein